MYVTYMLNNILKKAEITEERYYQLRQDSHVKDLMVYPSVLLMEQNYTLQLKGNSNTKNFLHG